MQSLDIYQNRNGENFQLTLCDDGRTPSNAEYWGYVLTVSHEKWGQSRLRILTKKTIASNKDLADVLPIIAKFFEELAEEWKRRDLP